MSKMEWNCVVIFGIAVACSELVWSFEVVKVDGLTDDLCVECYHIGSQH
jgi:hypothetical protein